MKGSKMREYSLIMESDEDLYRHVQEDRKAVGFKPDYVWLDKGPEMVIQPGPEYERTVCYPMPPTHCALMVRV